MIKKYQIFISATYNDLQEERNAAINTIIKQRQIPSGMEFFGAMGEKQWDYIRKEIDNSDYYVLIIGGKYGSVNEHGISYTEAEFDYAYERGIRIMAFLIKNLNDLPVGKCEQTKKRKDQLAKFRSKIEKKAGLVDYWTDIHDLELKIGNSMANVLREFPAETGWIRIDKDTNVVDFFNKGLENIYDSDKYENETILFPELEDVPLEKSQINYDVDDPSRAVVICESSYVQLKRRDGRIEQYMVDICKEFIKLLKDRNTLLGEDEVFCLRKIWFNTISPEVVIYLDYLYEYDMKKTYSTQKVKEMFYNEEVLKDGICYVTLVRNMPVIMHSDHFYLNNKEFYESTDLSRYLRIYWEEAEFKYSGVDEEIIVASVKIGNAYLYPLKFKIEAEFEEVQGINIFGVHTLASVIAKNEKGEETFALEGHEARFFRLYFEKENIKEKWKERPFNICLNVENDSPQYE